MILLAGGTGQLGMRVVSLMSALYLPVRVLTRTPSKAAHIQGSNIELVSGDVEDPISVNLAMSGVSTVISAIHGFLGTGDHGPRSVDWKGNSNLIKAAQANGVEQFILISIQGAAPDHPMELFRMKYLAEQELQASGLTWIIIRPTAYMETWAKLVGEPLVKTGKTRIFGRGNNPINFVSVQDVARFVEMAVMDPSMRNTVLEVGGPENLTMTQVAQTFQVVTGKNGKVSRVPLPMMRLMSVLMRPVNPMLARQIQGGVVMDTMAMAFDSMPTRQKYPDVSTTSLADMVRRDFLKEVR